MAQRPNLTRKEVAISAAVGVALLGWLWKTVADQRENNRHLNPAIFQAFRAIESACLRETYPHETVRCVRALEYLQACGSAEFGCTASEMYDKYADAGFDLPPYYEPGYTPR